MRENEDIEFSNILMISMSNHQAIKEQELLIVMMHICVIRISHSFDEKLIHSRKTCTALRWKPGDLQAEAISLQVYIKQASLASKFHLLETNNQNELEMWCI